MLPKRRRSIAGLLTLALTALFALALASSASAKLTGEFTMFQQCPLSNPETNRCLYSRTTSGEVILGNKKVPIEKEVILQGGYTKAVEQVSHLVAASNGVTLSKTPQNVPGGLAGLVNCKEISDFFLRVSCEITFENGLTGVNSTLELAKPPSEVLLSEVHLAEKKGVALKMPVKVHLENPFLGSGCYVGSSSSPIVFELTTGTTSPPPPNEAITGSAGVTEFLEKFRILRKEGVKLVDNAWSAPHAHGCGGFLFELIINPIIDLSVGLPSAAGHNTAILEGQTNTATALAVRTNDEENP